MLEQVHLFSNGVKTILRRQEKDVPGVLSVLDNKGRIIAHREIFSYKKPEGESVLSKLTLRSNNIKDNSLEFVNIRQNKENWSSERAFISSVNGYSDIFINTNKKDKTGKNIRYYKKDPYETISDKVGDMLPISEKGKLGNKKFDEICHIFQTMAKQWF